MTLLRATAQKIAESRSKNDVYASSLADEIVALAEQHAESVTLAMREALEASSGCCETSVWHQCNLRFEALKKAALAPGAGDQWIERHRKVRDSLAELVELIDWAAKNKDTIASESIAMDKARDALAALDAQEKR
jgi:hypothetical protein